MKTLKILKIFFRLKAQELKAIYAHVWMPIIGLWIFLSIFLMRFEWWREIFVKDNNLALMGSFWVSLFLLFLIFAGIYFLIQFIKWLCSNWQKAKRIAKDGE